MRKDMKKKLVETYRVRSSDPNADVRRDRRESRRLVSRLTEDNELEDVSFRRTSGMRMRDQWNRKQFGENLSPLARFLWSCRGKHWDSVYAEISEHCDKGSAVGNHIFEHLWGYVVKDVKMLKGKPHEHSTWREGLEPITSNGKVGGWHNLYIHPQTGMLLEAPKKKKTTKESDPDLKQLDELRFAVQKENVWYLVELEAQEYKEEAKIVVWQGEVTKRVTKVPVHEPQACTEKILNKLPRKIQRQLSKGVLYVKTAKTMSKKEKRIL